MIYIIHVQDGCYMRDNGQQISYTKKGNEHFLYHAGHRKPNYPVPAIVAGISFGEQNGRFYRLYLEDSEGDVVAEWFKDDDDVVTQVET